MPTELTPEERAKKAVAGMFDWSTIEYSIADQIRCAIEQERERHDNLLVAAWDAGFKHCLNWYGIWKNGVQTIGCRETPIKEATPMEYQCEMDITAILRMRPNLGSLHRSHRRMR